MVLEDNELEEKIPMNQTDKKTISIENAVVFMLVIATLGWIVVMGFTAVAEKKKERQTLPAGDFTKPLVIIRNISS